MEKITDEQIRNYRLHAHHLDRNYDVSDLLAIAGVCGLQNTPPGSWENAVFTRIPTLTRDDLHRALEEEKTLLQAWSYRGAPVIFPAKMSEVFLSALIAREGEGWIYTRGIALALEQLHMDFDELLTMLKSAIVGLDEVTLKSKITLDQTLADWLTPLLPANKRDLWQSPSPYGNPTKQVLGGAVVSFLLRPCSFLGLIVFGKRERISPTFTSYKHWLGHDLEPTEEAEKEIVRTFLRAYGPATLNSFASWLGSTPQQAKRLWDGVGEEIVTVGVDGKERFLLAADRGKLISPPEPKRRLHFLAAYDPYLGLYDRELILGDKAKQRKLWQTTANPGAILLDGEVIGYWRKKKSGKKLDFTLTLWQDHKGLSVQLKEMAEDYALFQGSGVNQFDIEK